MTELTPFQMHETRLADKQCVLDAIKRMTRQWGRITFGIGHVSMECGISESKLWDCDSHEGILLDLSEAGVICMQGFGKSPDVSLDDSVLY